MLVADGPKHTVDCPGCRLGCGLHFLEPTFSDPDFPFMADHETFTAAQVRGMIRSNVARERERCAKIAGDTVIRKQNDSYNLTPEFAAGYDDARKYIASKIRSGE